LRLGCNFALPDGLVNPFLGALGRHGVGSRDREETTDDRIPTAIWVMAHLRRCSAAGIPATLVRRGDASGGSVLLKLNQLDLGCRVLTRTRDLEGRPAWLAALNGHLVPEAEADAYIGRAVQRDPDLWVVEVEDRDGEHPFEGKML